MTVRDEITIIAEIVRVTEALVVVRMSEGGRSISLPRVMVDISRDDPVVGIATISMDASFAEKKGLIRHE